RTRAAGSASCPARYIPPPSPPPADLPRPGCARLCPRLPPHKRGGRNERSSGGIRELGSASRQGKCRWSPRETIERAHRTRPAPLLCKHGRVLHDSSLEPPPRQDRVGATSAGARGQPLRSSV